MLRLACLLVAVLAGQSVAQVPPGNGFTVHKFRSWSPQARLEAYSLLAQWQALQELAGILQQDSGGAAAVQDRMRRVQQQLQNVAHHLELTHGELSDGLTTLQKQLAEELAADLTHPQHEKLQPSKVPWQQRALTLINAAWFFGCVLMVLAVVTLVGKYIAILVFLVPVPVWEAVGHGGALWILHRATQCVPSAAPLVGLTGLLLFTACTGWTIHLHLERLFKDNERATSALMGFFALVYGAVAVRLQASLLGTLAVWWTMSALGFFIATFPFLTIIGFQAGMLQSFCTSLALILVFLPFKAAPDVFPMPSLLRPFETGVWVWCTLVMNVANLILAHRQWGNCGGAEALLSSPGFPLLSRRIKLQLLLRVMGRYALFQLPSVAVIGGTLACGVLLDVEQARAVGAVFGFLYLMDKLGEWTWKRVSFAWAALLFGGAIWASAYAVHHWQQVSGGTEQPATT